jgi:hypothetical protein
MLTKEEFVKFIVEGSKKAESQGESENMDSALPDGFGDFGFDDQATDTPPEQTASFARNLMEASGFGLAQYLERSEVILGDDPAAKYLSDQVYYWSQSGDRPYQTLLFELETKGTDLLKTPLFRSLKSQQILEDALSRLVQMALKGFERGGELRTASVKQGRQTETLCIVSCKDDRENGNNSVNLVCFGTVSADQNSLETFHIREEAKYWEPQIRDDHLEKLYKRHFSKLISDKWQNAFISGEERKLARKLLDICIDHKYNEKQIQKSAVELLEEIAKSFGLRRKGGKGGRRLIAFDLPSDHDIGADPEKIEKHGGANPFKGMTLRDENNRLLGYIIYCLDEKKDAVELRTHLKTNNRFHNVLIIYPDGDHAELELWQGKTPLAGKLTKQGANYQGEGEVVNLLSRFFVVSKAKVRNPVELAQELAFRARYLRKLAIKELKEEEDDGPLRSLYKAFKESLVHDQMEEEFADAFAQTLTYGLLTARWMGSEKIKESGDRFTRQNALKYLPTTSNFLSELFETALSLKLDEHRGRLLWLVDDIANLLDRVDVNYVFGTGDPDSDQVTDPVIHFYEPFLAEYDMSIKNQRGVFFTPRPVVSFIVRSVHERLQKEFGLADGLAAVETWGDMQKRFANLNLPDGVKETDPFVCILDPATGTGTFLFECIDQIEQTMKKKWCIELNKREDSPEILERWRNYVSKFLINRLYGYELMMASYAIAHLKLSFKLSETGYGIKAFERLNLYLTNSLEPPSDIQKMIPGFTDGLAKEAEEVNAIKRKHKFTVVIGNPPYAGHSSNKGNWISELVHEYYYVDGQLLGEKNPKWLQDDYVKFIRFGEYVITQTGIGIHSFITNHGYLDNPTFRGMRQHMARSFNSIDFLDLHGNSIKKESSPDGSEDKNVFDIKQGVAIFLATRNFAKKNHALLYRHSHLFGSRFKKYNDLLKQTFLQRELNPFHLSSPFYSFLPQNSDVQSEFYGHPSIVEIMPKNVLGFQTHRDHFAIDFDENSLKNRIEKFRSDKLSDDEIKELYKLRDNRDWNVKGARRALQLKKNWKESIIICSYRLFDKRFCYFSVIAMDYPRRELLDHVAGRENLCICVGRQGIAVQDPVWSSAWIAREPVDSNIFRRGGINIFPLYLYEESNGITKKGEVRLNFSTDFLALLYEKLNLKINVDSCSPKDISPESIIYYSYALFYSLKYRIRYKEFLKTDFPRLPISLSFALFYKLSKLGKELSDLHLMKSPKLKKMALSSYIGPSNPEVKRVSWINDAVWIDAPKTKKGENDKEGSACFKGVPESVWNYFIGGFRPCEKWLKDRKGRTLTPDDIEHYKKIIAAISETISLQAEIDKVIEEHGGWPGAFITDKGDAA